MRHFPRTKILIRVGTLTGCILLIVAAAAFVGSRRERIVLEDLPPGLWAVVDSDDRGTFLARQPDFRLGVRRRRTQDHDAVGPGGEVATLLVRDGRIVRSRRSVPVLVNLRGGAASGESVRGVLALQSTSGPSRSVVFAPVGVSATVTRTPSKPNSYYFEAGDNLWRLDQGRLDRLTDNVEPNAAADDPLVGIEAAEEQGLHLMQVVDPLPSRGGELVAFVTNREFLLPDGPLGSQSIWIRRVATDSESALLSTPGVAYTLEGWMGGEVVYTRSDSAGIFAVDPRTRRQRKVADGELLAVSRVGAALAHAEEGREGRVVRVNEGGTELLVPQPPAGYTYDAFAAFSVSGRLVALLAGTPEGRKRLAVFDLRSRRIQFHPLPVRPGRVDLLDPPAWVDDRTLLLSTLQSRGGRADSRFIRLPTTD